MALSPPRLITADYLIESSISSRIVLLGPKAQKRKMRVDADGAHKELSRLSLARDSFSALQGSVLP